MLNNQFKGEYQFECSTCEWNDSFWFSRTYVRLLDTLEYTFVLVKRRKKYWVSTQLALSKLFFRWCLDSHQFLGSKTRPLTNNDETSPMSSLQIWDEHFLAGILSDLHVRFNNFLPYCFFKSPQAEKILPDFQLFWLYWFQLCWEKTRHGTSNHDTRFELLEWWWHIFFWKKFDRDTHFPLLSQMTLQL